MSIEKQLGGSKKSGSIERALKTDTDGIKLGDFINESIKNMRELEEMVNKSENSTSSSEEPESIHNVSQTPTKTRDQLMIEVLFNYNFDYVKQNFYNNSLTSMVPSICDKISKVTNPFSVREVINAFGEYVIEQAQSENEFTKKEEILKLGIKVYNLNVTEQNRAADALRELYMDKSHEDGKNLNRWLRMYSSVKNLEKK